MPEPEYGTDGAFVWISFKLPNSITNLDTHSVLSDKQKEVLAYCVIPRSSREILEHIGVTNHSKNRDKVVNYLVSKGLLERTIPDTPNSPSQKYIVKRM
ncbi:Fic family protein [Bacteroides sp.]